MLYKLVGREVVECPPSAWARWITAAIDSRIVLVAETPISRSRWTVTTAFLGLDSTLGNPPRVFETKLFSRRNSRSLGRYPTWEEAETGHARHVAVWTAKSLLGVTDETA